MSGKLQPWAAGLAAIGCLTSCASGDARLTRPTNPASTAAQSTQAGSAGRGECRSSGFTLSLASGYHGWASPVEAAHEFARQSDPAGYGTPSTTWTTLGSDQSGVTLVSGTARLHAVRLPNGRWAIDSGQRCT